METRSKGSEYASSLAPSPDTRHRVLLVAPASEDAQQIENAGTTTFVTATSALACHEVFANRGSRAFDALVIDWTLPVGERHGLLEALRRADCPAAVIALVPPGHPEALLAARQAGAICALLKTADYRHQLPQAIEMAIEQARLRDENRRLDRALRQAQRHKQHLQQQLQVLLDRLMDGVRVLDSGPSRVVTVESALTGSLHLSHNRSAPAQLTALRETLVAVASHQLKNPLTVILGYSTLLLKSPVLDEDSRARRAVARIRQESLRLRHLADNLLEFSRLELGRGALQAVPFDLATLVRSVATRPHDDSHPPPIRLRVAAHSLPYTGDYGRLAQVLECLLAQRAAAGDTDLDVALGRCTTGELAASGVASALPPGEAYATITVGHALATDIRAPHRADWQPFASLDQPGVAIEDRDLGILVSAALVRKHGGMLYTSPGKRGEDYLLVLPLA